MKIVFLTAFLALLFMATSNLHAASGTYIDCMHRCSEKDICNKTFSSILSTCNAKWKHCEGLCPPQDKYCRDSCMRDRRDCLRQDTRSFDCPVGPQVRTSECRFCHEDDR